MGKRVTIQALCAMTSVRLLRMVRANLSNSVPQRKAREAKWYLLQKTREKSKRPRKSKWMAKARAI